MALLLGISTVSLKSLDDKFHCLMYVSSECSKWSQIHSFQLVIYVSRETISLLVINIQIFCVSAFLYYDLCECSVTDRSE
jgi:hypothetical protein